MQRVRSTQKLPSSLTLTAREAPDDGDGDGDARGGREEVVHRQRRHLGEVAHSGFATIVLPVGVGGEADRRVERQRRTDARQMLWVQREMPLQPRDGIGRHDPDQAEDQHRYGVAHPALLALRVNSGDAVDDAFDGREDRRQQGALAVEDAHHIGTQRPGQRQHNQEHDRNLQPTRERHARPPITGADPSGTHAKKNRPGIRTAPVAPART